MRCFIHLFPDDERSKNACLPTKELRVKQYLDEVYPNKFIHDKVIQIEDSQCTPFNRRADFQTIIGNHILTIEVDERQHKYYDPIDEERRLMEICESAGLNLVCIRFNPDSYRVNGQLIDTNAKSKYPTLKKTIDRVIDRIEHGNGYDRWLTEIKLFYDDNPPIIEDIEVTTTEVIITTEKITKKTTVTTRRRLRPINQIVKDTSDAKPNVKTIVSRRRLRPITK
uniref:Endonuclease n=1 Tax=Pithovirus LCPAC403 TaxID=2506596 RepID=A0A481ZCE0_9VIRU|nr:MAG: endonuclease [Pithovirus LCPAC403]